MNADSWAAFVSAVLDVNEGLRVLTPVGLYVLGMAIYAVFVFKFYRFIAARDMFGLDLSKNDGAKNPALMDFFHLLWYGAKYLILFPGFAAFWFAVLTLILIILAKDQGMSHILVVSLATVSVIRIMAYYNENLSRDLAKILPFAVLGVFLIDSSFFNLNASLQLLYEVNGFWAAIAHYTIALVALEFSLRVAFGLYRAVFPAARHRKADSDTAAVPSAEQESEASSDGVAPGNRVDWQPALNGQPTGPGTLSRNESLSPPGQSLRDAEVQEQLRSLKPQPDRVGATQGGNSNSK
ncbi:MAG: hypothetical protein F4W95_09105 [Chloroflexi bacterium]|nr:hypothetical protein [Chloroflexota bacterium]MYD48628.1 hypothetical protein [Chloroflexota bacterium]